MITQTEKIALNFHITICYYQNQQHSVQGPVKNENGVLTSKILKKGSNGEEG